MMLTALRTALMDPDGLKNAAAGRLREALAKAE
jgi:hypothetical protein